MDGPRGFCAAIEVKDWWSVHTCFPQTFGISAGACDTLTQGGPGVDYFGSPRLLSSSSLQDKCAAAHVQYAYQYVGEANTMAEIKDLDVITASSESAPTGLRRLANVLHDDRHVHQWGIHGPHYYTMTDEQVRLLRNAGTRDTSEAGVQFDILFVKSCRADGASER